MGSSGSSSEESTFFDPRPIVTRTEEELNRSEWPLGEGDIRFQVHIEVRYPVIYTSSNGMEANERSSTHNWNQHPDKKLYKHLDKLLDETNQLTKHPNH